MNNVIYAIDREREQKKVAPPSKRMRIAEDGRSVVEMQNVGDDVWVVTVQRKGKAAALFAPREIFRGHFGGAKRVFACPVTTLTA